MTKNQDKLRDAIEEILDANEFYDHAEGKQHADTINATHELVAIFLKESKEREKEAYEKGKVDGFTEYSTMELKKYNREKQREHRQKALERTK